MECDNFVGFELCDTNYNDLLFKQTYHVWIVSFDFVYSYDEQKRLIQKINHIFFLNKNSFMEIRWWQKCLINY